IDLEVVSYNMLGVVYRRLDLIRAALDYHKQALDLAESVENPSLGLQHSIAVSQNSMGNIYLALKQYDLALNMFNKSLIIEQHMDNKLGLAINHQNIGYALEEKGNLDDALTNYQTSLRYNNLINSDVGRVICYNSIAKIYIKREKYEEALRLLHEALDKALASGDQFYVATTYNNLGWAQLSVGKLDDAEANLKKGLSIAQEFNLKSDEIASFSHLSDLYSKKDNYQLAFEYYKKSENLDKIISNERNIQYVNDLILKYESEKKNSKIKALANENEIVKLKLEENRKMYFVGLGGLLLIIIILYILYRQRKLRDEKKIVTLEQDMLRNQMNPHFIFNSLNSIKLYIINNEKENAVYYLNKFSKLIRKILVASTEKDITLEEELETMELYMNIENMRFSNQINYKAIINPNIETSMIKVPSLIL
ncbi:MAG: tetratricopeptide repeat protein, partial [Mangrovimonas sp.]|nr:tetratricopeptide repeat protein [Mangrovimonas sp.]